MGQERVLSCEEFSFDKEIAERRMCRVGLGRNQDDFGVAGELDFPRAYGIVGN